MPDGSAGLPPALQKLKVHDLLVAVNGRYTAGLDFKEAVDVLKAAATKAMGTDGSAPCVALRIARPVVGGGAAWAPGRRGVKKLKGVYYSTLSSISTDEPPIVRGPFKTREESARAFDADVLTMRGCGRVRVCALALADADRRVDGVRLTNYGAPAVGGRGDPAAVRAVGVTHTRVVSE